MENTTNPHRSVMMKCECGTLEGERCLREIPENQAVFIYANDDGIEKLFLHPVCAARFLAEQEE